MGALFVPLLAGAGAAASIYGTVQAGKAQKKAAAAQQQQQEVSTRRDRMQAIREMQIKRAQAISSAQGAGALDSSGATGGIGSMSSQLGSNLGFSTQMSALSANISRYTQQANKYSSIAGLGGQLFSAMGGWDAFAPNRPPAQGSFNPQNDPQVKSGYSQYGSR